MDLLMSETKRKNHAFYNSLLISSNFNRTELNLNFSKSYFEEFWVNKCEIHCVLCDSDCSRDCGLSWKCPLCESVVTDNDNSVVTRAENFHFDCVEVTGVQIIKFVLVLQSEKRKNL